MPSVFDTTMGLIGQGDLSDRLGTLAGTDRQGIDAVAQAGTPAILDGLANRIGQPDGPRAVLGLLDGDTDSALDDADHFVTDGDPRLGTGILNSIFGGSHADVIDAVSRRSGIGASVVGKVLPMLAPLVVGALARIHSAGGLDESRLTDLIGGERADLERRGLLGTVVPDGAATPLVSATEAGVERGAAAGTGAIGRTGGATVTSLEGRAAAGVTGTAAAAATGVGARVVGFRWLWWALTGVAAVAAAAIGLAQCGTTTSANGTTTTVKTVATQVAAVSTTAAPSTTAASTLTTAAPTTTSTTATTATTAAPATTGPPPSSGATINDLLKLDPVTFEVSSARITAQGQGVLDKAAAYLAANAGVKVEIGGHTDSDGDAATNLKLSQARADSVKAYLVGKGIDAGRMTTKGYGETTPKVANDSGPNKAVNRRIEFTIQ